MYWSGWFEQSQASGQPVDTDKDNQSSILTRCKFHRVATSSYMVVLTKVQREFKRREEERKGHRIYKATAQPLHQKIRVNGTKNCVFYSDGMQMLGAGAARLRQTH